MLFVYYLSIKHIIEHWLSLAANSMIVSMLTENTDNIYDATGELKIPCSLLL